MVFLKRRLNETIFGGLRFNVLGKLPIHVKIIQLLLFLLPLIIIPFGFIQFMPFVMAIIPAVIIVFYIYIRIFLY